MWKSKVDLTCPDFFFLSFFPFCQYEAQITIIKKKFFSRTFHHKQQYAQHLEYCCSYVAALAYTDFQIQN